MKNKIIAIFVCMLMITIVAFPVLGTTKINESTEENIIINLNDFENRGDLDWAFCWINDYIDASDLTKCDNEYDYVTERLSNKGNFHQYHVCQNYESASHWNYQQESGNIDPADIAIFRGHGASGSDSYYDETLKGPLWREDSSNTRLTAGEANNNRGPGYGYGNSDLEWIAFGCCKPLEDDVYGSLWRWDNTFNGLHQILGYKTNADHVKYASAWMYRCTKSSTKRVAWSWFKACDVKQSSGRTVVVLAETMSMFYDYLHGFKDGAQDDPTPNDTQWAWWHTKNGNSYPPEKNMVKFPDRMTVYRVIPKNITPNDVENLGEKFGITGSIELDDDTYCLDDESLSIEVNKTEGFDYSDDSKLWIPTEDNPDLPTFRDAEVIAADFLNLNNFMPKDADPKPKTIYSDIVKKIEINEDIVLEEFPVAISVAYTRILDDFPVFGPGGCCMVYITDNGELTGLTKIWRDVVEEGEVTLFSQNSALDLLDNYGMKVVLNGLPVYDNYEITNVSVGYYEAGFGEYQKYLIPVYIFFIDFYYDGRYDSSDIIYIPAAERFIPPIAEIDSPSDGAVVPYGTTIRFVGSASYGNPPYSFMWESDIDGYLGSGPSISISNLSDCIEHGDFKSHTIKLTVIDQDGVKTADIIRVTITSDNNAPITPDISGPNSGKAGTEYSFSIVSNDPNGDPISYYILLVDGEDGGVSKWFGPYTSGDPVTMKYTWAEDGEYQIFAKAKDIHNAESELSAPFSITIPRNKHSNFNFKLLNQLLECFTNLFPILRQLIRLG